jgi:hypothetical protein
MKQKQKDKDIAPERRDFPFLDKLILGHNGAVAEMTDEPKYLLAGIHGPNLRWRSLLHPGGFVFPWSSQGGFWEDELISACFARQRGNATKY